MILPDEEADKIEMRESMPAQVREQYVDWTGRFDLQEKKDNEAVYTYHCSASETGSIPGFFVKAQEMVECYCNGQFVDVSFWGKHCFDVRDALADGDNEIKLVCTGNAANIYENADIPFGLL